jgi:hypothetical protein
MDKRFRAGSLVHFGELPAKKAFACNFFCAGNFVES